MESNPAAGKIKTMLDKAALSGAFAMEEDRWRSLCAQRSIVEIDARKLSGFFLPVIVAKAKLLSKNSILLVRQNFEPVPLYNVLGKLGFVYYSDKINDHEFCAYFVRKRDIEPTEPQLHKQ